MFCIVPKNPQNKVIVVDDDGNVSERDRTEEDTLTTKIPLDTLIKSNKKLKEQLNG